MELKDVITFILQPIFLGALGIMWYQLGETKKDIQIGDNKIWIDLRGIQDAFSRAQLDAEKRYVNKQDLSEFKGEMREGFADMKESIDRLTERLERNSRVGKASG